MKFGIIVYPGSNCDQDMYFLLKEGLGQSVVKLWHKDTDLQGCDFLIVPGGFSYGDYLRAGAIARFSPIMQAVTAHAEAGGYVWGICNGFQILTEAGLLPGTLLRNTNQKYICKNVQIKAQTFDRLLTQDLEDRPYTIPIAHAEGRYYADPATLQRLANNQQILFSYVDETGKPSPEANPNGSLQNIAGICNATGNVFGMMPHPERAASSILGNTDGLAIFESLLSLQS
ncbi:MAG: phosphoribosylformylglycinamidine synthase subunit PurQ [Bernardetiaceae bacterium]